MNTPTNDPRTQHPAPASSSTPACCAPAGNEPCCQPDQTADCCTPGSAVACCEPADTPQPRTCC